MNSGFLENARRTIARYGMLKSGDTVLACVSGGADSVALLHVLLALKDELALTVYAAHLNHGLRGAESIRDEDFVRELCGRLNIELVCESADVRGMAETRGLSLEEAGREARYSFFAREASARGAYIATAHTQSDSVETALLNFARGTALRGLCGIPPKRGNIIRPLIHCMRREVEAYCAENGIGFITDSSNESDDYARNRIRRHVIPVLESVNGAFFETAGACLSALSLDADYLDKIAEKALRSLCLGQNQYSRADFLALGEAVRPRVLLLLLRQNNFRQDRLRLSRLMRMIEAGAGAEQLSGEIAFTCDKKSFALCFQNKPVPYFEIPVDMENPPPESVINVFSDKKLVIFHTDYEYYEKNNKNDPNLLKNALDCARIERTVKCRQKLPADSIRLNGRGCSKTLRKLFNEAKVPLYERARAFILADSSGPLWVEGFGVCERAAVTEQTKRVLIMEVLMEE